MNLQNWVVTVLSFILVFLITSGEIKSRNTARISSWNVVVFSDINKFAGGPPAMVCGHGVD